MQTWNEFKTEFDSHDKFINRDHFNFYSISLEDIVNYINQHPDNDWYWKNMRIRNIMLYNNKLCFSIDGASEMGAIIDPIDIDLNDFHTTMKISVLDSAIYGMLLDRDYIKKNKNV